MSKHTPTPYYVGPDAALDCPDHANSGLALVDTGRANDWPIARLCEWHTAEFIARACNAHDDLLALAQEVIRLDEEDAGLQAEDGIDVVNLMAQARAALAKATGESK
jgi:hypothetical protein